MSDDIVAGDLDSVMSEIRHDATAVGMVAFLYETCVNLTEQGWDIEPMLYSIERILPPQSLADEMAEEINAAVMILVLTECAAPWIELEGYQAAAMMHGLANALRQDEYASTAAELAGGRDIIGWLFACEGWGVVGDRAREREAAEEEPGRISDDPDRIEFRILNAADRAGYRYSVNQQRGGQPLVMVDRSVHHEGERNGVVGNIPDALADLAEALPVPG